MFAAVKLVVALCVVTRPRLARCQSGEADPDSHRADTQCGEETLQIQVYSIQDYSRKLYIGRYDNNISNIVIPYGALMTVCSGVPSSRLTLTKNGEKMRTDKGTEEIWVEEEKLDIQKSLYVCNDLETGCQLSVVISATPALEVTSKCYNIRKDFHPNYTIEYGDSVTVSCSAPNASRLVMTKDGKELITVEESQNTIKYFHSKQDLPISKFVCTDIDAATDTSVLIRQVPLLYIQPSNQTIVEYQEVRPGRRRATIVYGHYIEATCCGPKPMELIGPEGDSTETVNVNATTVKTLLRKFNESEFVFSCIDSEDPDSNSTLIVRAKPRLDLSPNVRRVGSKYAVKYGEPVDILCSWVNAVNLSTYLYNNDKLVNVEVQTLNETTVKYHTFIDIFHNSRTDFIFYCSTGEPNPPLTIHLLPEALDFRCVSYVDSYYLNCSWKSASYDVKYTWFYMTNGELTNICMQQLPRSNRVGLCTWGYSSRYFDAVFSFLMQSCNNLGCYNQTFLIDRASIVKLGPPYKLKVHSISSRGTILYWTSSLTYIAGKSFSARNGDIFHRVVYWYSGINPREVNASLVLCDYDHCEIHLTLPCPAIFYEVRVYQKLMIAIGEEYWSDPSTVTFFTKDDINKPDDIDSTCNIKPKETKEVIAFANQNLRYEVQLEIPQFEKKVDQLRDKVALIHTLLKELTEN